MPNNDPTNESEFQKARLARDEAQLMLAQMHGVVWLAINDVDAWLPKPPATEDSEPELVAEDVRSAGAEIHGHFGAVHAALNTGEYDHALVKVGITGAQGRAKRKGLLPAITRLFRERSNLLKTPRAYAARLRACLRWAEPMIGSIAAALEDEIKKFHGASFAAEGIKEFMALLSNAAESLENGEDLRESPKIGKQTRNDV
jgi:hypothetical protein